jgi:hypothetical protein
MSRSKCSSSTLVPSSFWKRIKNKTFTKFRSDEEVKAIPYNVFLLLLGANKKYVLKHNDLPFGCCGAETGHVPAPSADYADIECRPLLLLLLA